VVCLPDRWGPTRRTGPRRSPAPAAAAMGGLGWVWSCAASLSCVALAAEGRPPAPSNFEGGIACRDTRHRPPPPPSLRVHARKSIALAFSDFRSAETGGRSWGEPETCRHAGTQKGQAHGGKAIPSRRQSSVRHHSAAAFLSRIARARRQRPPLPPSQPSCRPPSAPRSCAARERERAPLREPEISV
jgi:hypothetical protein